MLPFFLVIIQTVSSHHPRITVKHLSYLLPERSKLPSYRASADLLSLLCCSYIPYFFQAFPLARTTDGLNILSIATYLLKKCWEKTCIFENRMEKSTTEFWRRLQQNGENRKKKTSWNSTGQRNITDQLNIP